MRKIFSILIVLLLLAGGAMAKGAPGPWPSSLVHIEPLPGVFALSGAPHDSMFAIEAWREPLGPYEPWEVFTPGETHMTSYKLYEKQADNDTVAAHLIAFRDAPIDPLVSVNVG